MFPDGPGAEPLFALLEDWERTAGTFEAIAEYVRTAHARTLGVAGAIAEQEEDWAWPAIAKQEDGA